jgi:hypothetical protein
MIERQHFLKLSVVLAVVAALAALAMLPGALAQSAQKKAKRIEEVTVREGPSKAKVKEGFEWVKKGENIVSVRSLRKDTAELPPTGEFECKCNEREKRLRRGKCKLETIGIGATCSQCNDCNCNECVLVIK